MFNYYNGKSHISKEESDKYQLNLARRDRINYTINQVIENKDTIELIYVGITNRTRQDTFNMLVQHNAKFQDCYIDDIYTTTSENIAKQSFDFLTSKLIEYYGVKCMNLSVNYQIPRGNLKNYKVFIMYKKSDEIIL